MTQEVQKYRLVSIGPGILSIAKVDRQGYVMRALNGALIHFCPIRCESGPRQTQYQSPGLKKLSLSPASVFDITEAKIDELGFGTLIDCIETG